MRVLPAKIKKMKHQPVQDSGGWAGSEESTKATKAKSERKHLCRQRETKRKGGRERKRKESPSMGSKFGEVSESVSECTVQAFECVSVSVCVFACACACA